MIRRDERIRGIVLASFVIILAGIVLLSHRPIWPTNRPRVAWVADLPARTDKGKIDNFISYGIFVPQVEHAPILQMAAAAEKIAPIDINALPRLGYSYREIDLFGLPLIGYPEFGYVLYHDRGAMLQMMPLEADGLNLLERETGARLERGFIFPFWESCWGLLVIAAGAGIWLFELGAARRKREALGMI